MKFYVSGLCAKCHDVFTASVWNWHRVHEPHYEIGSIRPTGAKREGLLHHRPARLRVRLLHHRPLPQERREAPWIHSAPRSPICDQQPPPEIQPWRGPYQCHCTSGGTWMGRPRLATQGCSMHLTTQGPQRPCGRRRRAEAPILGHSLTLWGQQRAQAYPLVHEEVWALPSLLLPTHSPRLEPPSNPRQDDQGPGGIQGGSALTSSTTCF